jgi:GDPmannose 4,6-dehydratase
MKRALITGITGQDGYYLSRLLLEKGYEVHGLARPPAVPRGSLAHLLDEVRNAAARVVLHEGDLGDARSLAEVVDRARPDELYHLAGQTQVPHSFQHPAHTAQVGGLATVHLLEAARRAGGVRFFHAASSEIFGEPPGAPQTEETPARPENPYGVAKLFGFGMVRLFRRTHGLFACNGILYNHESPHRGEAFVTRKIARAVAAIRAGRQTELVLGDLEARRDWGFAGDYVDAFWRMLQADDPDDFLLATGATHSVREFCELAFAHAGLDYRDHVKSAPLAPRAAERTERRGDASHARRSLGWAPRTPFPDLVRMMVDAECALLDEVR